MTEGSRPTEGRLVDTRQQVGLCASCVHSRIVESARGSLFWMCRLSETDAQFRKYPPLPVVRCDGFREAESQDGRR